MIKYAFLFLCFAGVYVQGQAPAPLAPPEPPLPSLETKEAPAPVREGKDLLAPAPAPSQPEAPMASRPEKVAISLPKATGNDIAQFYRQLTGKRVLVDAGAAGIEANIIVFGDGEDKDDAIKAFNKALLLNGLAIVPSGENEVKLINTATGSQNAKIEGIPVIADELDLPEGDNVITYVMPLRYIMPEEASRTFNSVVGTLHRYGSITAVPNASALIITENASLIRTFVDLKNKIDVPTQQIASKWIDVKYADVESLAQTLEKITKPETTINSTARRVLNNPGGQVTVIRESIPAGAQGPMVQGGSSDAPAQIIPDTRTNRLLLMGRPMDLVFLETLISQFDIPTDTRNSLRRKLCYLTVLDFMPVAQNALERISPEPTQNGQNNSTNRQNSQNSQNNRNTNNNSRSNTASAVGSGSDMLTAPESSGAPDSVIVGRTLLVADTITNSIVVQGPPQSIEVINQLLDQIDIRGPQVMISTIFGQFRCTDNREFGVDWLATMRKTGNFSYGGSDFTTGSGWNPSDPAVGDKFSGSLSGLSFYGKFAGNINFLLRAAMDTGKFSVLSRPTVFTVNNQKAVIASGQKVAVPTSQLTDATGSGLATNTSINYMNIVLKLEVIPLVNSEKEVTLQVGQLNDQIIGYQKIGGADASEVPTISTQQIITTVTVPNGGTVILGGLITRDESDQKYGIPLLSDIPVLGSLFSTKVKKMEEREIVIFIQPTIVNDNKQGYESQLKERSRYQGMPQAMQFAEPMALSNEEHEGLLPVVAPSELATEAAPAPVKRAVETPVVSPEPQAPPTVAPVKKTPRFRGAGRQFGAF